MELIQRMRTKEWVHVRRSPTMLEGVLLCWNITRCMRINSDVQKHIWIHLHLCRWMGVEYCSGVDVCSHSFRITLMVLPFSRRPRPHCRPYSHDNTYKALYGSKEAVIGICRYIIGTARLNNCRLFLCHSTYSFDYYLQGISRVGQDFHTCAALHLAPYRVARQCHGDMAA